MMVTMVSFGVQSISNKHSHTVQQYCTSIYRLNQGLEYLHAGVSVYTFYNYDSQLIVKSQIFLIFIFLLFCKIKTHSSVLCSPRKQGMRVQSEYTNTKKINTLIHSSAISCLNKSCFLLLFAH